MKIEFLKIVTIPLLFLAALILHLDNSYAQKITDTLNIDKTPSSFQEIKIATNEYDQEEIKKTIDDASLDAKKNEENAKKSLIEAKKIIKKSNSAPLIEIARNRATIEQSRKEIAKLQLSLVDIIKKTNKNLNNIALSLANLETQYLQEEASISNLNKIYQETSIHWRLLADNSLKIFSKQNTEFNLDIIQPLKSLNKIPQDVKDESIIKQYQDSYNLLQEEYENILKLKSDLDTANKNYQSNLLLKSGKLRADILQTILSVNQDYIKYDNIYIDDLFRETKLIPYRPALVFYSKILEYKKIAESGFVGAMHIIKQIGVLLILVTILLVSKGVLSKLTNLFNKVGQYCVKQSINNISYTRLAVVISKLNPYFKWIILIILISLINVILENSLFEELSILIPYFQYYFLYKIFRIFIHYNLSNLVYKNIEHSSDRTLFNKKIKKTTKSIGVYLLSSVWLLHLTQTIVRKAYFYDLATNILLIGLLVMLALITASWKDNIQSIAQIKLSERSNKIIKKLLLDDRRAFLFSFIILSILIVKELFYKITSLLNNHDFFKNLLSQIYRKKLESAAKNIDVSEEDLSSQSYIKEFSKEKDTESFIHIKNHPYEEIQNIIDGWQCGKTEENSIAIYGQRGVGKSKLIEKIVKDNSDLQVIQTVINKKITNKDDFLITISLIFKQEIDAKELFKFLSNYDQKTLIILDDCHNLFLAKEGGFDALKTFFNLLVKIDNPNLLWISSFNYHSWHYLQNSLKIDTYFRYNFKLSRWSDENIRELIMSKHENTGFRLVYDPLIFSINTHNSEKEFEDLQLKFFQIIWSQSKGNPNIAINLWFSSLNQHGIKSIKISLPKVSKTSQLNQLSDEHLFVYAAIAKHQNLSVTELSNILLVPREEIINIIRIGLERDYLIESAISKKRFNISHEWQIAINQLLINRNFIYAE